MTAQPDDDALTESLGDSLARLDWQDYTCQCPQHPDGCQNRAAFAVAIHAIGACNRPGLDPFGNRVEILCLWCLATLRVEVADKLRRICSYGGIPSCEGCAAPLVCIEDVVRGIKPL